VKTLYAACISRLGLSQAGAAALHDVSVQSVKNWCSGRSAPPDGIWSDLREREAFIIERAETIREVWEDVGEPCEIEATWVDDLGLLGLADFICSGHWDENAPIPRV
jgi:hypothetical protein